MTALNVFAGDDVIVDWTEPTGPIAPTDYDVVISQGAVEVARQDNVVGLTATFAGLGVGNYTVTVTPNYPAGSGVNGTAGVDTVTVALATAGLVFQEIEVARPEGALVLTQRCGVSNVLPAVTNTGQSGAIDVPDAFPGFPFNLVQAPAVGGQGLLPANRPILVDNNNNPVDANGAPVALPGVPDPEFGNYPLPNDDLDDALDAARGNVTQCGLDMGVARLVTEFNSPGALAGEFFAASGRLNEITVLDTRDLDEGWELRIDVEDRFIGQDNGDSFSGDYLGMIPTMTDDSDLVGGEFPNGLSALYDQTVVTGLPGTAGARAERHRPAGRRLCRRRRVRLRCDRHDRQPGARLGCGRRWFGYRHPRCPHDAAHPGVCGCSGLRGNAGDHGRLTIHHIHEDR